MAGSIYSWSLIAGDNDDADGDINWLENQFPDTVNDSARQMMGRGAEFRDDITGALAAAGTANVRTITARSAFTSLANGRMVTFRSTLANTGATTLNVNSLGAKAIRKMGLSGDVALEAGDLLVDGVYIAIYSTTANANAGGWLLIAPYTNVFPTLTATTLTVSGAAIFNGAVSFNAGATLGGNSIDAFPAGTRMLFQQTAAPPGWTKVTTTYDNRALRLVTGTAATGGSVDFTAAFSTATATTSVTQSGTVGNTSLTTAQIPGHTHGPGTLTGAAASAGAHTHGPGTLAGVAASAGAHTHAPVGAVTNFLGLQAGGPNAFGAGSGTVGGSVVTASDGAHTHTVDVNAGATASGGAHTHTVDVNAGATASAGSGGSHTHTFTGDAHSHTMNLAVKYIDVILAVKD